MGEVHSKGFVGGYAKITRIKEGTPKQKRATKLAGAKRAFRLKLYVAVTFPYNVCGNVEGYRLVNKDRDVEIKVNGKWYPKFAVSKHIAVIRATRRKSRR